VLSLFILDPHRFVYPQAQIRDWALYGLYPPGVYSNAVYKSNLEEQLISTLQNKRQLQYQV